MSRKDGAAVSEDERETILQLVRSAVGRLRLKNDRREPADPRVYDYDGYEKGALGILLYSGYSYGLMPEEVQKDQDEAWANEGARVGAEIEQLIPGVYAFVGYGVED
ncbi:hypothetical protein [Dactylosporangium sp. NPDC048998]|uniref:hypothetical protein n=1 Tax=Dactylosporangium sp. NPDC048998 TaxID=3363976 RepID=UPI0037220B41